MTEAASAGSAWQPFRARAFRALWIATVASNVGTWMHDVGAGWMMTTLSADPLMVALVQAATSLPMFLFALPAGVLADIVDRRRFLLFAQVWMLLTAAALAALAWAGLVTPPVLLVATFLLGTGAALNAPPFQAIVPELVPKADLPAAVALNSLGINVSRAIGPALGGFVLSLAGPPMVFALNAASVLGVLAVVFLWKREPVPSPLPPENFLPAIRSGIRYVGAAPALRVVLVRALAFFTFGSAAWALLPLVARGALELGPGLYGALLACIGAGAVVGALCLPRLRTRLSPDSLTVGASLLFAGATLALAWAGSFVFVAAVMLAAGFAWIAMLSTLNVGAQRSSAGWVKARALAVYLVVFYGAMAAGSAVWGQLAARLGVGQALFLAAVGMALASASALRWRLGDSPDLDLAPSLHWAEPAYAPQADRGPVLATIEYRIAPEDCEAFLREMPELRRVRRRVGALTWAVYEDSEEPGRWLETFVAESWLDHLRQHRRVSRHDQAIQARVDALHRGAAPPRVRHLIAGGAAHALAGESAATLRQHPLEP